MFLKQPRAASDARLMRCPSCGAAAEEVTERCRRCGAPLAPNAGAGEATARRGVRRHRKAIVATFAAGVAVAGAVLLVRHDAAGGDRGVAAQPTTARPRRTTTTLSLGEITGRRFTAPDGSFSVEFFAPPGVGEGTVPIAEGRVLLMRNVGASDGAEGMTLQWGDVGFDVPPGRLYADRRSFLARRGRTLTSRATVEIAGHPGERVRYREASGDSYEEVVLLSGRRLFILQGVAAAGTTTRHFGAFVASFRLR
jgi:hypothetical protein